MKNWQCCLINQEISYQLSEWKTTLVAQLETTLKTFLMYHFHLTIRLPSHEWITHDYVTWPKVQFFDQRSLSYPLWLYCTVVLPKSKALQQLCIILRQRISPDWCEWSLNETDSTQARKNLFRLLNNNTVELDHDLCKRAYNRHETQTQIHTSFVWSWVISLQSWSLWCAASSLRT